MCRRGPITNESGLSSNLNLTSWHEAPPLHGVRWRLFLVDLRNGRLVPCWPRGPGVVGVETPNVYPGSKGVAGGGSAVGNTGADQLGKGVGVGGRVGIPWGGGGGGRAQCIDITSKPCHPN